MHHRNGLWRIDFINSEESEGLHSGTRTPRSTTKLNWKTFFFWHFKANRKRHEILSKLFQRLYQPHKMSLLRILLYLYTSRKMVYLMSLSKGIMRKCFETKQRVISNIFNNSFEMTVISLMEKSTPLQTFFH